MRQRMLRELELLGEATSTVLAERLGVTSYNLRSSKDGLGGEVPERVRGEQDPERRSTIDDPQRLWLAEDLEMFARFDAVRHQLDARRTGRALRGLPDAAEEVPAPRRPGSGRRADRADAIRGLPRPRPGPRPAPTRPMTGVPGPDTDTRDDTNPEADAKPEDDTRHTA
ncbi:hypothetical protein ACRAKI_24470 [Saccharothrix isguenensis]